VIRIVSFGWPFAVLLGAWQIWIAGAHVPKIIAPSPIDVALELAAHPLVYLGAAATTAGVAFAGLVIGMTLGTALAIGAWLTPFAIGLLTLPALLVQSTPLVALLPVLARLLGYGETTVVAGAALITFLSTFVFVGSGLLAAPPQTESLFTAFGSSRLARLRYLALPAATPRMLLALRVSAANSVLAALVAEYLMGVVGLGRMFADAQEQLLTAQAWAASLVATALSVSAYALARRAERLGEQH
jgi:ABC-type nitrate/sulfonate/bicarbonate transport system permease component